MLIRCPVGEAQPPHAPPEPPRRESVLLSSALLGALHPTRTLRYGERGQARYRQVCSSGNEQARAPRGPESALVGPPHDDRTARGRRTRIGRSLPLPTHPTRLRSPDTLGNSTHR